jgi:type IV pilus assembly protein PilO
MATLSKPKFDFAATWQKVQSQFQGLDPNDPSTWPLVPRMAACLAVMVVVMAGLWYFWLQASQDELAAEQDQEQKLKEQYKAKLGQAINLEALKKQLEQVQQYVTQLEKQLPGKADMDALLSDINQAAVGRSLQFELFRPGGVSVKEYYAELPITIRVTGRYHDVGAFASDIAQLSRIVTLNNVSLAPSRDGMLTLDTVAKTFRYLDTEEVASQRKGAAAVGAKK